MLQLTAEQEALLRLPEPTAFLPKLAAEIRRDWPREVSHLTDAQLLTETERSYDHASHELHITRLPTLVKWVKLDVAGGGQLRREMNTDLYMKQAADPNLAAEDLLSVLAAQGRWRTQ